MKAAHSVVTGLAVVALVGLSLVPTVSRADGDPVKGRKLGYACLGCHGIENYKNAYPNYSVPRVGGQHAAYIVAALHEYEAKARWHPTMQGMATTLSAQDKQDIAAYFQGNKTATSSGPAAGVKAPQIIQTCQACHGANGIGIMPEYPDLAGQHADYIVEALHDYRSGKRKNVIMNGMAAPLTDEQIKAVAAYYSQQHGLHTLKED